MCVYSFSKKNSSSILFVKLAQLRIKMSCLSSSPHVGFWKHYSTYLVVCSIALYILVSHSFWPNPLRAVHQSVDYSLSSREFSSPLLHHSFWGALDWRKIDASSEKWLARFFFHISSPLNTVDYFRGEIHLNRSNVANVLTK